MRNGVSVPPPPPSPPLFPGGGLRNVGARDASPGATAERGPPQGESLKSPRRLGSRVTTRAKTPTEGTASTGRRIRVLVAKPGLDGHDRGAKVIARALRDAGMEVIYTGLRQTPEQVKAAAVQEDADVVALSLLSGAHMTLVPKVVELLHADGVTDVMVLAGGIIPPDDAADLKKRGVAEVYGPGTPTETIVEFIRKNVRTR